MLKVNKNILYYKFRFSHLSTNKMGSKVAPHKPLLLLSVIDLEETGIICSPCIELSDVLIEAFKRNASRYTYGIEHIKPYIRMPFFYMRSEPFWQLVPNVNGGTPGPTPSPRSANTTLMPGLTINGLYCGKIQRCSIPTINPH